jgi:hypothetical protein
MRVVFLLVVSALANLALATPALAQTPDQRGAPAQQGAACPPDVRGEPPTVGGTGSQSLSDQLANSKGVICPPAAVDPEMQVSPPGGGRLKIIPPPGSPGGDQSVQPK